MTRRCGTLGSAGCIRSRRAWAALIVEASHATSAADKAASRWGMPLDHTDSLGVQGSSSRLTASRGVLVCCRRLGGRLSRQLRPSAEC